MSQQNKAAVERLLQAFASAPESAVGETFTTNWVNHDPSLPPLQGLEGAAQLVRLWRTGFSHLKVEIEDALEEGDKVACRFRISGTHTGPVMGIPASGKSISVWSTARRPKTG